MKYNIIMTIHIPFTKMHGSGNDYIYINTIEHPVLHPEKYSELWSRPHTGIGSDGLVLIGNSQIADFSMRIFNADGSEAMMCGNASRCIGKYVYEHGLTQKNEVTLETLSGIKRIQLHPVNGRIEEVSVDMGIPLFDNPEQIATHSGRLLDEPLTVNGQTFRATFVSMGNPHLVIFMDNVSKIDLETYGFLLEHHPLFPQKTNVEFAEKTSNQSIRMRVWERGSGITQACGTGACATAAAAYLVYGCDRNVEVTMDGGSLHIEWSSADNHIHMTGPAVQVFEGQIEIES